MTLYTNRYIFKSCYIYFIQQRSLKHTLHSEHKLLSLLFFRRRQKYVYIFIYTYYNIFCHIPNGLWLVSVVVTTKLMFSYSFTWVNDEFYEGRGHKLSRTDGRCNSLRRWMVTGDGGNRDRPYTCKAKLNSCLVFAIKSASHRVERQFF